MTRIAITGVGIICAGGLNREEFWANVVAGRSAIAPVESLNTEGLRSCLGGEIKGYRPEDYFSRRQLKRLDKADQYAVTAAREAIVQSGLDLKETNPYQIGVVLGTSLGGMQSGDRFHRQWLQHGLRRARASLLLNYPIHTPCDAVAHFLGIKGPRSVISTACAAGTNALGLARDLLLSGQAKVMLAGGVDSLCILSFCGFSVLRALSPGHCAPYSRSDGLNIGEGAAVLVLEPLEAAQARGAKIMAEFLGYGLSADAYHPTAPDPGGQGAAAAMRAALRQGNVRPEEVSYINGHGTGTPANDQAEPKAMRLVFGELLPRVPISSTKSMIGHMLGAAGAIEAATCVLAVERDIVPPTINFQPGRKTDLDFVPNQAREHQVNVALSNSFAFGGNNACLLIGKYREQEDSFCLQAEEEVEEVLITGIGAVGTLGSGFPAWWEAFREGKEGIKEISSFSTDDYRCRQGAEMPPLESKGYATPGLWRRMDTLSRQCLVSARLAVGDSGLKLNREESKKVAVLFATGTGPLETVESFNRGIILNGPASANPILFPNTVMNATAGYICMVMGFQGPTSTITAGGVSSLTAVIYAAELIRQRVTSLALVVSGDEFSEVLLAGHDCLPGLLTLEKIRPFDRACSGTVLGAAGISFLLEAESAARERGAKVYARVLGAGMTGDNFKLGGLHPRGQEWAKAMELALERSGIAAGEIGYCAAAACGVPVVDYAEARALSGIFGAAVPVGAPKSITGDCLGSSGAVNMLAGTLALQEGIFTPTLNLRDSWEEFPLRHVKEPGTRGEVNYCLVNAVAFGGNYVSLVLGRAQ